VDMTIDTTNYLSQETYVFHSLLFVIVTSSAVFIHLASHSCDVCICDVSVSVLFGSCMAAV